MADIEKIDSHWERTVEPSILEQYRGSERWKGVLKSVIDRIQDVENDAFDLSTILRFDGEDRPEGFRLDWIGSLVNVSRKVGEEDSDYFVRIKTTIGSDNIGTPDGIIGLAGDLSQSDVRDVHYFEESPATFFVYTPKGRQLSRRQVKSASPSGVLGAPAAAIVFADGKRMVGITGSNSSTSVDGGTSVVKTSKILCVAQDENIGKLNYLVIDGKPYKIGKMPDGRTWMLENLAYLVDGATYNTNRYAGTYGQEYIDSFGYMYTAEAAMNVSNSVPGWHVPTMDEWNALINAVGATYDTALPILGSSKTGYWNGRVCQDTYGFNALPGGYTDSGFGSVGTLGRYHALLKDRHIALWFNTNLSGKLATSDWAAGDTRKHSSIRLIKDA